MALIADRCGLSRSSLRLVDGELRFGPDPDAPFEAVDCALRELRRSGELRNLPMGFIGNEAPESNDAAPR